MWTHVGEPSAAPAGEEVGETPPCRVGVVGFGAIGSVVVRALVEGAVEGLTLSGVHDPSHAPEELAAPGLAPLVETSDVIVEAAGSRALVELAPVVLGRSRTLVALSVGAFLAPELQPLLRARRAAGRLVFSTGAISGLDLVRAARMADGGARIHLSTTKKPASLVQPWMDDAERAALTDPAGGPRAVFRGSPIEAARLFPANLNVAAALAIAAGTPEAVTVELTADPATPRTRHELSVSSELGSHRIVLENLPSPDNPATSALVPWAVLRCLAELGGRFPATFR